MPSSTLPSTVKATIEMPRKPQAPPGTAAIASVIASGIGFRDGTSPDAYFTRVGLLLGSVDVLDEAKKSWMEDDTWQGLRRFVEDSMVLKDPFELFVVQNVVLDGLLYPLVYETIVDDVLSAKGGTPVAMLTQFMTDWFAETRKWADATVKIAAAESAENKEILTKWLGAWRDRAAAALLPVARIALGDRSDELVGEVVQQFNARMAKAGVPL